MSASSAARRIVGPRGLLFVWGPVALITTIHYGAPHHAHWVHDIARRAFYLPIVMAGALGGVRWGLATAGLVLAAYTPHAFLVHVGGDPGGSAEKLLEMGFYVVLGAASGGISERLHAERRRLEDLTERLTRSLEEIRVKDALLARSARLEALGQLTAGLAHEIRNPLHAMRGTAEILLDAVPPEAPEYAIGQAHLAEIDRLARVLSRFLDFARPRPPVLGPVDLAEVARHVADLVRAQASRQGTRLEVVEGGPCPAWADRDGIVQVAVGICINAFQALGEGGTVRLSAETRGEEAVLNVENDGPPIPAELLDRIFDPFVTGRDQGTGLGLATAWRIVADQGGRIVAENLPGPRGVVFRVVLPREAGDQGSSSRARRATS